MSRKASQKVELGVDELQQLHFCSSKNRKLRLQEAPTQQKTGQLKTEKILSVICFTAFDMSDS